MTKKLLALLATVVLTATLVLAGCFRAAEDTTVEVDDMFVEVDDMFSDDFLLEEVEMDLEGAEMDFEEVEMDFEEVEMDADADMEEEVSEEEAAE